MYHDYLSAVVEVYDPKTDQWSTVAPMPTPLLLMEANVVNDKIYLIGGTTSDSLYSYREMTNITQVFDPRLNSWSTAAAIPRPLYSYASAVMDGKIYLFGGVEYFLTPSGPMGGHKIDKYAVNKTQIYDPETDKWTLGAPIPQPVRSVVAGATTGVFAPRRIYVVGGYDQLNQVYDPATDCWTKGNRIYQEPCCTLTTLNDTLYVLGGTYHAVIQGPDPFHIDAIFDPPFGSFNVQYIPFGYGNPISTPPVSVVLDSSSLVTVVIGVVAFCVLVAGLLVYFKKRKR